MKMIGLAMLLALMSSSAMAEWTKYSWSDQATVYIDLNSVRKSNRMVRMKYLMEFSKVIKLENGTSVISIVGHYEFNCDDKKRYRQIDAIAYKESMGSGHKIVDDNATSSGEWVSMAPNTLHESLWKFGCEKN